MRYRLDREARERGEEPEAAPEDTRIFTAAERAAIVESAIQQAIRRGEFDDLPGAGKPIPGLSATHDPDWWIRRKIERENLTGLGPPALLLRTEYAALDATLDGLRSQSEVREHLEDFNRRVIEARRQLLGGPPVITPTVDVDERLEEWRERKDAAVRPSAASDATPPPVPRRRWFFRGGVRRST
ncbi:DnaJ family domain-containing protein [Microbacterium pygmaeum]|nr:DUF1992 domain-containing protein [Microbacterium pygmaeum]